MGCYDDLADVSYRLSMNSLGMIAGVVAESVVGEGSRFLLKNVSEVRRRSKGSNKWVSHVPLHGTVFDEECVLNEVVLRFI